QVMRSTAKDEGVLVLLLHAVRVEFRVLPVVRRALQQPADAGRRERGSVRTLRMVALDRDIVDSRIGNQFAVGEGARFHQNGSLIASLSLMLMSVTASVPHGRRSLSSAPRAALKP